MKDFEIDDPCGGVFVIFLTLEIRFLVKTGINIDFSDFFAESKMLIIPRHLLGVIFRPIWA